MAALEVILGFVAGLGIWVVAFILQFAALGTSGSKLALAVCPLVLVGFAAYYCLRRDRRSAFTTGMLIALSLAFLISSACGVQIAREGLGG